jgi:nucleotide-binding universal stress UspA family protein
MRKIFVPTDFSESSEIALKHAMKISEVTGAAIEAVYVIHLGNDVLVSDEGEIIDCSKWDQERITQMGSEAKVKMEAWKQKVGDKFSGKVRFGKPVEFLLKEIAVSDPSLVVIGKADSGQLKNLFTGTMTDQLIRRSSVPFLVVQEELPKNGVRNLLISGHLDLISQPYLNLLDAFVKMRGAKMYVLPAKKRSEAKEELPEILANYARQNNWEIDETAQTGHSDLSAALKQKDEELNIDVFAVTVRFRKSFQLFGNKELYALTSQLHKPILIFNN